jgi:hypothetical protein
MNINEISSDFYTLHKSIVNVGNYGCYCAHRPYNLRTLSDKIGKFRDKHKENLKIQGILEVALKRIDEIKGSKFLFSAKVTRLDTEIQKLSHSQFPQVEINFKRAEALIEACVKGDADKADRILSKGGIDCNLIAIPRILYKNKYSSPKYTLLHHACLSENIALAKVLLKHGANPRCYDDENLVHSPVLYNIYQYFPQGKMRTVLFTMILKAICKSYNREINYKVRCDADVLLNDTKTHDEVVAIVKKLLQQGSDVNAFGKPVFHDAIKRDDQDLVRSLIYHGIDPGLIDQGMLKDEKMRKFIDECVAVRDKAMNMLFLEKLEESDAGNIISPDPLHLIASYDPRSDKPVLSELNDSDRQLLAQRCHQIKSIDAQGKL